jgi:hypothetical protein
LKFRKCASPCRVAYNRCAREKAGKRAGLPVDYILEDAAGNNQTFESEGGSQTVNFDITGPPRPQ